MILEFYNLIIIQFGQPISGQDTELQKLEIFSR